MLHSNCNYINPFTSYCKEHYGKPCTPLEMPYRFRIQGPFFWSVSQLIQIPLVGAPPPPGPVPYICGTSGSGLKRLAVWTIGETRINPRGKHGLKY